MDDEHRLVGALTRRDRGAWATMYDRHVGSVFGVAYHVVGGDREVAEDVNQEVWLLAIEQIDRFDPSRGAFRDWLLGIARHRALHRRREQLRVPDAHARVPLDVVPPLEMIEGAERIRMVRAALVCLNDDHRRVLLDKYAEGFSVAEIAARTGRTAKAVESLLSRAREQLRALLRPYIVHSTGGEPHAPSDARTAR